MNINAAKLIVFNEKHQLLLLKSKRKYWTLPGGKLNPQETIWNCLEREVKEEVPGLWGNLSVCMNYLEGHSNIDVRFSNAVFLGVTIKEKPINIANEIVNSKWIRTMKELHNYSTYWADILTQPIFRSGMVHILHYYFSSPYKFRG